MILFVRHGETEHNKQDKMQGRLDIPLNEVGESQAKHTAEELKNQNIDVIYSSPLARAKQTAEIINKYHNKPILIDDRINEIELGNLTGTKRDYKIIDSLEDPEYAKAHGAEDFGSFYKRCVDFYNSIENTNQNVLIVAHSGVGYQLKKYLKMNKDDIVSNCEIVTFKK